MFQKVAIVAAHPDDEVIGAGSRLPSFRDLVIIHTTDGAPRNMQDATAHGFASRKAYALRRRQELEAALTVLGANHAVLLELGFADQETCDQLPQLIDALNRALTRFRPELILTHPYEGGHPDHDACALAVATCARCPVVEFASYHAGPDGIRTGEFLPNGSPGIPLHLSPEQQRAKRAAFDCFVTQRDTLSLFGVATERFRPAPRYDFTQPPHEGPLYYEQFDWGMTGTRFRQIAAGALAWA